MKQTAQSIANEIRMARAQFHGIYVLVEGSTDVKFLRGLVADKEVRFIDAQEKTVAIDAIRLLNADNQNGILAIVDADFDRLPPRQLVQEPNLLYCDCHDLEAMLIMSPTLEKVLHEHGSTEKIEKIEQSGRQLRWLLLNFGQWIGALRLISINDDLNLKFDETKFSDFIPDQTPEVEPDKLVKAIKNHSSAHKLQDSDLLTKMQEILDQNHPLHELACGHDLATILGQWLRKLIGSCKVTEVSRDKIESYLRLGYEQAFFETTQLYMEMRKWEAKWAHGKLFAFSM